MEAPFTAHLVTGAGSTSPSYEVKFKGQTFTTVRLDVDNTRNMLKLVNLAYKLGKDNSWDTSTKMK